MGENQATELGINQKPAETLVKKQDYVKALKKAQEEYLAQETKLINRGLGQDRKGELNAYAESLSRINQLILSLQNRPDALEIIRDVYKGRIPTREMAKNILNDLTTKGRVGETLKKVLAGNAKTEDKTLAQKTFNNAYNFYKKEAESLPPTNTRKLYLQQKANNALGICQAIQNI